MQQDEHIPIVSGHELFVDDTVLNDTHIHGHADHAVENTTQQAESAHDFMMTAPVPLVEPAPLVDHEVDAMDVLVRDQDEQGVQHVVPHRTSTRVSYPPLWMKYYAATVTDSIPHSLANYMTYMKLSPTYQAYLSAISVDTEPRTYEEAVKDPRWVEAMKQEIRALEDNGTWNVMPLPSGKSAIGCKWVFKIKYKANGQVDRFKARLVAKGYSQTEGIDYHETFSPVVKMVTVRSIIAIAAAENWMIY